MYDTYTKLEDLVKRDIERLFGKKETFVDVDTGEHVKMHRSMPVYEKVEGVRTPANPAAQSSFTSEDIQYLHYRLGEDVELLAKNIIELRAAHNAVVGALLSQE
jgi:hypothetical protein